MKPKKDLNYIAKVEKAIAKKYGNIAIQNPASFWDEEKEKKYIVVEYVPYVRFILLKR